ncbi:polysaccharide biosynthesis protein [Cohnella fermenti]|uniref:Polysaccharide biosynthesis protein n=1 Tax=Cohnella fermenti TaxID=2565925 RepID=A0A4S4BZT2_9BACL|nr:nucleoside-diphosphate sugar epimerase/dehydratase [Cohnella fermenti]THF80838.1 polysaccharide biosynthesis protein [Cohnella fermenti]
MVLKRSLVLLSVLDLIIVWFSTYTAYWFRFPSGIPGRYIDQMLEYSLISTVLCMGFMVLFGMYRRMWQYASIKDLVRMCEAVVASWALAYMITSLLSEERVPLSVAVRTLETGLLLLGGVRVLWRLYGGRGVKKAETRLPTLIFGAGDCGDLVAREFMNPAMSGYKLVGFLDDDPSKRNLTVHGLKVFGGRSELLRMVESHFIKEIIIAIPSAPRRTISQIINLCLAVGVKPKIIPGIDATIKDKISFNSIREVDVEDLLGREPVKTDLVGIAEYVQEKVVLVTGAGGSIGSELCRQIAPFRPSKLLLLGHGENSIYTIEMEMRTRFPGLEIEPIIADVQDRIRMEQVFSDYRPNVVFHAAAHKHVPLMEKNPSEAVKNNVFGTQNVADCADKYGTERFVLISSDKAVNPTSIMGATKRIAEMYIQNLNIQSATKFAAVRFGNVLGSRGSVIPLFKRQIASGGPVTVTHPEMVRYFMTIPEAVQLVIQAGSYAKGGETFLLDMGEPVSILKLAEDLIRLSGFEPYSEIDIQFTGMREGEKLYEELLMDEEGILPTPNERIFIGKASEISQRQLDLEFTRLERVLGEDSSAVKDAIESFVPILEFVS